MDSPITSSVSAPTFTAPLPGWTLPRGREPDDLAAAFAAGDLLRRRHPGLDVGEIGLDLFGALHPALHIGKIGFLVVAHAWLLPGFGQGTLTRRLLRKYGGTVTARRDALLAQCAQRDR